MKQARTSKYVSRTSLIGALLAPLICSVVAAQQPPGGAGPPPAADSESGFAALTRVFRGAPDRPPSIDPHDFEGTWLSAGGGGMMGPQNIPYTAEARAIADRHMRMAMSAKPVANTHITCRPNGPGYFISGGTVQVVQTADQIVFMYGADEREVMQVFINGKHPDDLKPSYNGHAIGHWEGNTLVVDITGFNGFAVVGMSGPTSSRMHAVVRVTKSADGKSLDLKGTIDDPAYYTKPWALDGHWNWDPTVRAFEFDCASGAEADYGAEGLVYENEQLRPICTRNHDTDRVICEKPNSSGLKR